MLTLRPTQKLARRLKLALPETTPVVQNYVADWCVQDFSIGRVRYLLFVNTPSLLPVIVPARGITNQPRLVAALIEGLKVTWAGTPAMKPIERWILPELQAVQLARIPGRSLLGSTHDFIRMADAYLSEHVRTPAETSRGLARAPMGYLGMNSPDRVFPTLKGKASSPR